MELTSVSPPVAGEPTVADLFDRFLAVQKVRLAPRTYAKYESVIELFSHCLNEYGHTSLDKAERAAFEKAYEDDDEAFCHIFGADKILDGLGEFLDYFMIRKVHAGQELLRAAGTVTKKLVKWLAAEGCISDSDAAIAADHATEAVDDLPKMERFASLLFDVTRMTDIDPNDVDDADWIEDSLSIARVEPGKLHFEGGIGPVTVPKAATDLAQPGWTVTAALARHKGRWQLVEVGNVYPY